MFVYNSLWRFWPFLKPKKKEWTVLEGYFSGSITRENSRTCLESSSCLARTSGRRPTSRGRTSTMQSWDSSDPSRNSSRWAKKCSITGFGKSSRIVLILLISRINLKFFVEDFLNFREPKPKRRPRREKKSLRKRRRVLEKIIKF